MSDARDALVEAIAALARALPDETIARVSESIATVSTIDDALALLERFATAPHARVLVQRTADAWRENRSAAPHAIALALRSAGRVDHQHRTEQQLELVWTGPTPPGTTLRRSDQVMLDLVRQASRTITIVSFAAYRIPPVHDALLAATDRGVVVRFILESREESGGRVSVDPWSSMSPKLCSNAECYVWPYDRRAAGDNGRVGVLHAKCAISDGRRLFVSSANFTAAALSLNMELGLLIEGGDMPLQVQHHFDQLISDGVLRRIGSPG